MSKRTNVEIFFSPEVQKSHDEYLDFASDSNNWGYSAEAFWMASRGLLYEWLAAYEQAEFHDQQEAAH